jgi:predicted permease
MASTLMFELVYAPLADPKQWSRAVGMALMVASPYALMLLAYRLVSDRVSFVVFIVCALSMVTFGGLIYSGGFGPNDGEYSLVFVLTPVLQAPLIVIAGAAALWRKRVRRSVA